MIAQPKSTTLTIRIDQKLKAALERAARASDRTVTLFVCRAIQREIDRAATFGDDEILAVLRGATAVRAETNRILEDVLRALTNKGKT